MTDKYFPIDKCIYCGYTQKECRLKDEHIIPLSLNGASYLPMASCGSCEKITSAFEGRVASKMFKSLRLVDKVKTRRPKQRPNHLLLDGGIKMPVDSLVGTIPTVHFKPPGFLLPNEEITDSWVDTTIGVLTKYPKNLAGWEEFNQKQFSFTQEFDLDSYSLLMAKIGHCVAVGTFGIDNFDHWLTPYILKKETKGIQYLVGGVSEIENPVQVQHEVTYEVSPYKGDNNLTYFISVKVRLFSYIGGPHCRVIVGATDDSRFEKLKLHIEKHKKLNNITP